VKAKRESSGNPFPRETNDITGTGGAREFWIRGEILTLVCGPIWGDEKCPKDDPSRMEIPGDVRICRMVEFGKSLPTREWGAFCLSAQL